MTTPVRFAGTVTMAAGFGTNPAEGRKPWAKFLNRVQKELRPDTTLAMSASASQSLRSQVGQLTLDAVQLGKAPMDLGKSSQAKPRQHWSEYRESIGLDFSIFDRLKRWIADRVLDQYLNRLVDRVKTAEQQSLPRT